MGPLTPAQSATQSHSRMLAHHIPMVCANPPPTAAPSFVAHTHSCYELVGERGASEGALPPVDCAERSASHNGRNTANDNTKVTEVAEAHSRLWKGFGSLGFSHGSYAAKLLPVTWQAVYVNTTANGMHAWG